MDFKIEYTINQKALIKGIAGHIIEHFNEPVIYPRINNGSDYHNAN